MAENLTSETGRSLIDDLRKIEVFADLPQEHLAWLAEKSEEVRFQPGEIFAREGEPVDYLIVILEGEIRVQRGSGPDAPILHRVCRPGFRRAPVFAADALPRHRPSRASHPHRCASTETSFLKCCSECPSSASVWLPSWQTASARPPSARRSAIS